MSYSQGMPSSLRHIWCACSPTSIPPFLYQHFLSTQSTRNRVYHSAPTLHEHTAQGNLSKVRSMDDDARRRFMKDKTNLDVLASFICVAIMAITCLAFIMRPARSRREAMRQNLRWLPYLFVFCWSCLYASLPLSKALIYLGIPKAFTFGYQIGKNRTVELYGQP